VQGVLETTRQQTAHIKAAANSKARVAYAYCHYHNTTYSINGGLVDILLEVTPTEEQKAGRIGYKNKKSKRANEECPKKKNTKYRRKSIDQEKGTTHEDMQITRDSW
jgi:hypothetical protein